MNVRDLMRREVVTVSPDTTVSELARLMLEQNLSGLPVVDSSGKVVGLVTQRDLVAKHAQVHLPRYFAILGTWIPLGTNHADEDIRHVLGTTARDLMTDNPQSIEPDASVDDAATLMAEEEVNPIPVVENGKLVGIISRADIIRILLLEERDAGPDTPGN